MTTKVIDNEPKTPCLDPAHRAPMHLYVPPGKVVIHRCPKCGYTVQLHGGPLVTL